MVDMLDPKRAVPKTASELPSLLKLRSATELPISAKSKIDIDDPNRPNPKRLTALLSRENDRKLRLLPR
jgi:hypothetical protein